MGDQTTRDSTGLVEARLKRFRSLRLDPAEVRASRDFHLAHWLEVAEAAICKDHAELYYRGLSPNIEETVAGYPGDRLPPAMQKAVLRDFAFMEGHLQALTEILEVLRRARKPPETQG